MASCGLQRARRMTEWARRGETQHLGVFCCYRVEVCGCVCVWFCTQELWLVYCGQAKSASNAGVVFLKTNTTICLRPWARGRRGTDMIGGPDTISLSTDYPSHQAETPVQPWKNYFFTYIWDFCCLLHKTNNLNSLNKLP